MDAIDLRLIDLLRENARSSYAELARQVGLSAPAVHERVGKLEAGRDDPRRTAPRSTTRRSGWASPR